MKLDKYTFARLVAFIGNTYGVTVHEDIMKDLDELIDVQVPQAHALQPVKANSDDVDHLLALMTEGTRQIEAIKMYRQLTGADLKEAKEAVERHWVAKADRFNQAAKLSDIIGNN